MSTNADIILESPDGKCMSIYCHHDGYPAHMVKVLGHYDTYEKVSALVSLGDASFVDETLDSSIFYCRDRGEELNVRFHSPRRPCEYQYVFRDGKWWMNSYRDRSWKEMV